MCCDKTSIVSDNLRMKNINQTVLTSEPASQLSKLQCRWHALVDMDSVLLYDLLALRVAVFVVEQRCIYQELDGLDASSMHYIVKDSDQVVACLRVIPPAENESRFRIGRVAVSSQWRKHGIARMMLLKAIQKLRFDDPACVIFLDAQTYLLDFYQSLGFSIDGDEFLEDGIPHTPMQYTGLSQ